jgi:hypothetical protein
MFTSAERLNKMTRIFSSPESSRIRLLSRVNLYPPQQGPTFSFGERKIDV